MSQNDVLTLSSNFENWKRERATGLLQDIKPFYYYCLEQFLKNYEFTDDDILYGYTDSTHDGGVDAIYFTINKRLIRPDTSFDHRTATEVKLDIFQIKDDGSGYGQLEINKLFFFTKYLLDMQHEANEFRQEFHAELIDIMDTFKRNWRSLSGYLPSIAIDYYYITKGDEHTPNTAAQGAIERVKEEVKRHFSQAKCEFHCINLQGLLQQIALRPLRRKVLKWSDTPMSTVENSFVGLVNIKDYYEFLKDNNGRLDEQMLEENVRGYEGDVTVNKQIRDTLAKDQNINFWLLNNGITIIASKADGGHREVALEDAQIVNGLQSSREIFKYFSETRVTSDTRSILVKVIKTADAELQDRIINATNSQTTLPQASLRATDPVHHRIEAYFKNNDLFYERRKKYYKDKRIPIAKIVSRTELSQAILTVLLQRTDDARRRPSNYFTDNEKYALVFNDSYELPLYLICVKLMRRVAKFVSSIELGRDEKLDFKFYMTSLLACFLTQEISPSPRKVMRIRVDEIDDEILEDCYKRIRKIYDKLISTDQIIKGPKLMENIKTHIKRSLAQRKA